MNRFRLPLMMGILVAFLFLVVVPAPAEPPRTDKMTLLFQRFMKQLDRLEEKHPQDQEGFFQLRSLAKGMFDEVEASRAIDPSRQPGLTPASRLGPGMDPMRGIDLYQSCKDLRGPELRRELQGMISHQYPVGYQQAQDLIFCKLDNHEGEVECVYTGRKIRTNQEPNASDMNVEHTWPQSQGATGDAKCDLHHLFPTDSDANNRRGSFPFGMVQHATWEEGGSRFDGDTFEVRPVQRGNTARAKFYFAVRYGKQIPANEEAALREWHRADPPDAGERARNDRIENLQHNRNPFVDHPEFVDQINDF